VKFRQHKIKKNVSSTIFEDVTMLVEARALVSGGRFRKGVEEASRA